MRTRRSGRPRAEAEREIGEIIGSGGPSGGSDRHAASEAVVRLVEGGPLADHERRSLALLIMVIGALDHVELNVILRDAHSITVDALSVSVNQLHYRSR